MTRKIVITDMPVQGRICKIAALLHDQTVMELRIWPQDGHEELGAIYLGQVDKVQPFMNAVFINIAPGRSCYLPLKEESATYIPHEKEGGRLHSMTNCVVQIKKEESRKKNPCVTAFFTLKTPHALLTHKGSGLGISKKLSNEIRQHYKEVFKDISLPESCGLVLRTNAPEASDEQLSAEIGQLIGRYRTILQKADSRPVFCLLEPGESGYKSFVLEEIRRQPLELRTDLPEVEEKLKSLALPELNISLYEDKLLPLYKLYRLETCLEEGLKEKVWLKSGGFLVIQQTDAFVSIDVNSGKYSAKKSPQEVYLKINLEAAEEITRQLRLRNLSGMILVDFISMTEESSNALLMERLSELSSYDNAELTVVDMTALGIVELTRKKIRKPLAEQVKFT